MTIDHWYDRTVAARDQIVALYDQRFYNMWTFYLAGAAAAFRSGGMCNYQIQLSKSRLTVPLTRDYIEADERRLRGA
jgi:cyclopropane-fatty-acyl-phospholipid synthase